jgi:hypothetical protein
MYCSYVPLLSQCRGLVSQRAVGAAKQLNPFDNDTLRVPALGTFEGALAVIRSVRLDTNNRHLVAAHRADQLLNNWSSLGPDLATRISLR